MAKLKKLTDEELMSLATAEFIELAKKYRDGDEKALDRAKYPDILKKRGLKLGITTNLIHRIFVGEFDNANGVEVGITKVEGKQPSLF